MNGEGNSSKKWLTTLILCWFLGFFGVHRFYAGKITSGFMQAYGFIASIAILFVSVELGLGGLVLCGAAVVNDFCIIMAKKFKDCYGKEICEDRLG